MSFLKSVLVWQDDETQDTSNSAAGYDGQSDLVTQLCDALDEKFVGVKFVSFGVVTVLVAAYLLLIGIRILTRCHISPIHIMNFPPNLS